MWKLKFYCSNRPLGTQKWHQKLIKWPNKKNISKIQVTLQCKSQGKVPFKSQLTIEYLMYFKYFLSHDLQLNIHYSLYLGISSRDLQSFFSLLMYFQYFKSRLTIEYSQYFCISIRDFQLFFSLFMYFRYFKSRLTIKYSMYLCISSRDLQILFFMYFQYFNSRINVYVLQVTTYNRIFTVLMYFKSRLTIEHLMYVQ